MIFKRKCKITFIRHGATINTEENRLFDDENYPSLNINGKYEIEKISEWIKRKGLKIDKIYSSSAHRCIQSARILSRVCLHDFEVIPNLTARKFGVWSGLSFEEIETKFSEMLKNYHNFPESYKPDGGESQEEFNTRTIKAITEIIENNLNKRLIIITHGDVIQSIIADILDIPPKNQARVYIPTGSATQISYYEDFSSLVYSAYIPV